MDLEDVTEVYQAVEGMTSFITVGLLSVLTRVIINAKNKHRWYH